MQADVTAGARVSSALPAARAAEGIPSRAVFWPSAHASSRNAPSASADADVNNRQAEGNRAGAGGATARSLPFVRQARAGTTPTPHSGGVLVVRQRGQVARQRQCPRSTSSAELDRRQSSMIDDATSCARWRRPRRLRADLRLASEQPRMTEHCRCAFLQTLRETCRLVREQRHIARSFDSKARCKPPRVADSKPHPLRVVQQRF